MNPRENRQKVMIKARMRLGASWHDVCILNVSRRGLGIQAASAPARGTYVEIRRGHAEIVARVIWAKGHRAGLQSQDPIFLQALMQDVPANDQLRPVSGGTAFVDRRRTPRPARKSHDESRLAARTMEFACMAIAVMAGGFIAFRAVEQALANPLAQIRAALGPE